MGINGDNLQTEERQLLNRLHRLEGQVRSLERLLSGGNTDLIISQFEATIAAAKGAYNLYLETLLASGLSDVEKTKLLRRLVNKL